MGLTRKEIIAANFGRCAETYERYAEIQRDAAETLAGFLPDIEAPSILETGCGTGFLTENLFQKYPDGDFLITDLSADMVAYAKRKFEDSQAKATFQVMDGENVESDKTFDLIVSNMTVQWFEDPISGLEKLKSHLKTNGKIFFTSLGPNSFIEWRRTLKKLGLPEGVSTGASLPGKIHDDERFIFYPSTLSFLKSVKVIGAHHPKEGYPKLHPSALKNACSVHDETFDGRHTWHIVYGCLEA
ncbi:MAG: methyltransferase domain-containing protein [Pseudomonadota bacterium]